MKKLDDSLQVHTGTKKTEQFEDNDHRYILEEKVGARTSPAVKYEGGSIMLLWCFTSRGMQCVMCAVILYNGPICPLHLTQHTCSQVEQQAAV